MHNDYLRRLGGYIACLNGKKALHSLTEQKNEAVVNHG